MNSPDFGSDIDAYHKVPGWAGGAAQVDAAAMSPCCRDRHTPDPGNTFSRAVFQAKWPLHPGR